MRRILLTLGLVLILVGGVGIYLYMQHRLNETEIVAAKINISQNAPIASDMVYLKKIHSADVLPGAFKKTADVVGKIAIVPMSKEEQVLSWKISGKTNEKQLGFRSKLKADEVAVTLPVSLDDIGGDIRKGDRLNIIELAQVEGSKEYMVKRIFANVEVLEVVNSSAEDISDEDIKNKIPKVLTLKIKKADFEAFSIAKQGKIEICILGYQEDQKDEDTGSSSSKEGDISS